MTLYTIDQNGKFAVYKDKANSTGRKKLDILTLIETNTDSILNRTGALVIGREVTINENEVIDLLAVDENGNCILFDIQKEQSSRDSLIKLIEKATLLDKLDYNDLNKFYQAYIEDESSEMDGAHYDLFGNDIVNWNSNSKIILISKKITKEVADTASYFRKHGLDILCIEFNYFINEDGLKMVSTEFIVGNDMILKPRASDVTMHSQGSDKDVFFTSLDKHGKLIFKQLLELANKAGFEFRWTSKGFSLNVMVEEKTIGLCYGYAQDSLMNQSIYTSFDQISKNIKDADEVVAVYQNQIELLEFFTKKRSGFRWELNRAFTENEVKSFFDILIRVADMVKKNGLIEIEADAFTF